MQCACIEQQLPSKCHTYTAIMAVIARERVKFSSLGMFLARVHAGLHCVTRVGADRIGHSSKIQLCAGRSNQQIANTIS
jgi:hypothetical protein